MKKTISIIVLIIVTSTMLSCSFAVTNVKELSESIVNKRFDFCIDKCIEVKINEMKKYYGQDFIKNISKNDSEKLFKKIKENCVVYCIK